MQIALFFLQSTTTEQTAEATQGMILAVLLIFGGVVLYVLPTILARNKRSFAPVAAINIFLGWTLVGWVVALAWALKDDQGPTQIVVNQTPTAAILCSSCGKYSPTGSQFCPICGASMTRETASQRPIAN